MCVWSACCLGASREVLLVAEEEEVPTCASDLLITFNDEPDTKGPAGEDRGGRDIHERNKP